MKHLARLAFILVVGLLSFMPFSATSQAETTRKTRKAGAEAGASVGLMAGFDDFAGTTAGAKLDILLGYRIVPHFALFGDLWTANFVIVGFELNPRVYILTRSLAPFVTLGIGLSNRNPSDSDEPSMALTYSAGAGLDWNFKDHQALQFILRYLGHAGDTEMRIFRDRGGIDRAIEFSAGYRWLF